MLSAPLNTTRALWYILHRCCAHYMHIQDTLKDARYIYAKYGVVCFSHHGDLWIRREKRTDNNVQSAEIDLQEAGTPIDEELHAHITNKSTISPDENKIYPIFRDPFRKFSRATSCTSGLGR